VIHSKAALLNRISNTPSTDAEYVTGFDAVLLELI